LCRADIASEIDLATFLACTRKVEVCAYHGRAAKGGEYPAAFRRLTGDSLTDGGAEAGCIWTIFSQPASQRTDEIAIGIAAEHLKTRQAALAEARSVILDRALLGAAHRDLQLISSNIARNDGSCKRGSKAIAHSVSNRQPQLDAAINVMTVLFLPVRTGAFGHECPKIPAPSYLRRDKVDTQLGRFTPRDREAVFAWLFEN
jgi:hypothetical protein